MIWLELTVAEEVDARIADVGEDDLIAHANDAADGRAHAGQFGMLEDGFREFLIGFVECVFERRGRFVDALERAIDVRDGLDGHRARDVPAGVAAHPVGDNKEVGPGVAGVLIVRADLADVGGGRRALRHPVTVATRTSSCRC